MGRDRIHKKIKMYNVFIVGNTKNAESLDWTEKWVVYDKAHNIATFVAN